MATEKIKQEQKYNHTHSVKAHLESAKLAELKRFIKEGQKKIGFDNEISEVLNFFFEKMAEGKTVSIIEQSELWSVTQAAKELGVTRPTVYKMYERGDIQGVALDGLKIIPSSVVVFLQKQEFTKLKALKELNKIDQDLKLETKDWTSNKNSDEYFEDIDLE